MRENRMAHLDTLEDYLPVGTRAAVRRAANFSLREPTIKMLEELANEMGVNKSAVINALIAQSHNDTFEKGAK
jgi:hypothetical protein